MKPIDVHTHLSSKEFAEDRAEALNRALGICDAIIDIGSGTDENAHEISHRFAESHPNVFFTAGVHPHDASTFGQNKKAREEIEKLLSHPKCVAVGECGLDYYYEHSSKEDQHEVFQWQIDLAQKFSLPLMIHTRDAEEDTMQLLKPYPGHAVFHCFTGTQALADFGVQKSFRVSFSGIVTFKTAEDLRKVARSLPTDRILIETDSPYLAPIPKRGKRNESSFLQHTAEFLAKELNMPTEDLIRITRENSLKSFPKLNISPNDTPH